MLSTSTHEYEQGSFPLLQLSGAELQGFYITYSLSCGFTFFGLNSFPSSQCPSQRSMIPPKNKSGNN